MTEPAVNLRVLAMLIEANNTSLDEIRRDFSPATARKVEQIVAISNAATNALIRRLAAE